MREGLTLEEQIDYLDFRQRLLFHSSDYDRLIFDHDITREENAAISEVFATFRQKIDGGEEVISSQFEQAIYDAVPYVKGNYHFAESLAQIAHSENRYEEVFETLYGDQPKFQHYTSEKSRT